MNPVNFTETLRISANRIRIEMVIVSGQDGEFFVKYNPSLNISGYGNTPEDAEKSFQEAIRLFIDDIRSLGKSDLELYLNSIGWSKQKLRNKNFSHLYVDENGDLQGLVIKEKKLVLSEFAA